MLSYVAILIPDREVGGYAVLFPDLPGCVTQGDDMAAAYEAAVEALAGHLAVMQEYGDEIPAPRTFEEIRADKQLTKENDFDWTNATAMPVFVRPPLGKPERVNVSLDSNKLRAIDAYAERRGLTRSAVLEAGADLLIGSDPVLHKSSARESINLFKKLAGRVPLSKTVSTNVTFKLPRDAATGQVTITGAKRKSASPGKARAK